MDMRELARDGDLAVDAIGGVLVLTLTGHLDRGGSDKLASCLDRAVSSRRPVVADLGPLTAVEEHTIDVLKAAHRRLGVRLHLVCGRGDPAWEALRAAGARHLFVIHATRPGALAAASPR
jgi:STAS domain